jgi:hypothetical protein
MSVQKGGIMAECEVCGNDYDKSFEVIMAGKPHVFDSFECAIHALAPKCGHCGCQIVGHAWRPMDPSFAVLIARARRVSPS